MSLTWNRESPPTWNADKDRIVGGAPKGAFDLSRYPREGVLPGEWWAVREGDRVVGYGWMDVVWGDAEILLAVASDAQGQGVGAYILHRLTKEASARGLRRMRNTVRPDHAEGEAVTHWLESHGFHRPHGGNELERPVPSAR